MGGVAARRVAALRVMLVAYPIETLILGVMAVKTKRLGLGIFTHAGFNLVTMIALAHAR